MYIIMYMGLCFTIPAVQLQSYRAVPFYTHAHQSKTGKSKATKTIPKPVAPGTESERRTLEDTQGYDSIVFKYRLCCLFLCVPMYVKCRF